MQNSASLSFCTLAASVSTRGPSCFSAGLSRIVRTVLLSMSLCWTSDRRRERSRWWEASTGLLLSEAARPSSSSRWRALLYASIWRCSSVLIATCKWVRPLTSGVNPWHPRPKKKTTAFYNVVMKVAVVFGFKEL